MSELAYLHRYDQILRDIELGDLLEEDRDPLEGASPVLRDDGSAIDLSALTNLLAEFAARRDTQWPNPSDRPKSDQWLAPRVHAALRLTRAQGADKGLWHWLAATAANDYVTWRWGSSGSVQSDRWYGPIHKQALARLWWGAEMFRDGANYESAERAFIYQDLINSFLHRPLVRSRSFALGLLDAVTKKGEGTEDEQAESYSSRQVNDLARVLNLCTTGRSPEAATDFRSDDQKASRLWASEDAPVPNEWDTLPSGPPAEDTTAESRTGGRALADHGMELAGLKQDKADS